MIKKLKKKFVLIAMFALTILLVILISATAIVSYISIENVLDNTLVELMNSPFSDRNKPGKDPVPSFGYNIENSNIRKNSFIVYITESQMSIKTDHLNMESLDRQEIEEWVDIVMEADENEGKIDSYKYLRANFGQGGAKIVFVDASIQIQILTNVIRISAIAAGALLFIMFILVSLLSSKAVKPFAENMEKQTQFITNAGHEIKTPLAVIMANAEAWELNPDDGKYISNIKAQTQRLSVLTNQLLLLAKADEVKDVADKKDILLSEVVEDILSEFTPLLNGRRFVREISQNVYVNVDTSHIKEVLNILTDNAVNHSSKNSDINVFLGYKQGSVVFRIENYADSLPDVTPETLFERFYRFDSSRNSSTGGSGIGLSIAKELVEANGGKISAEFAQNNKIIFNIYFKLRNAKI